MTRFTVTQTIKAPVDQIFNTISSIDNYSKAVTDIVSFEILSDVKSGVGTRFRETRLNKGREATTELEVTEFVENDRIRMVTDSDGAVWDSVFNVKEEEGHTKLTVTMDAKPHKLMPKMMIPMMKGTITKGLEKDMQALKLFCEK